eukprot:6876574-Ditylum_brightwellii.AAC.1
MDVHDNTFMAEYIEIQQTMEEELKKDKKDTEDNWKEVDNKKSKKQTKVKFANTPENKTW